MARRIRVEVEGGLYHLITRGVDRQDIFHDEQDRAKFLSLVAQQKLKVPFYFYAYCLMTNHIHLLVERRLDDIGRIMQRLLTGYAQYYNRRYRRVGHVFQGRHKAILCQSDPYLAELVRYIHLNPVRAKMVELPEQYPYSSHSEYISGEAKGIVDVDPVLRRYGQPRAVARQRYLEHIAAGIKTGTQARFYDAACGILGSEEFVDSMIHRIGEHDVFAAAGRRKDLKEAEGCNIHSLLALVERRTQIPKVEICSNGKNPGLIYAKEVLILSAKRLGASLAEISDTLGLNASTVTRRHDAAKHKLKDNDRMAAAVESIVNEYRSSSHERIAQLQV